MRKKNSFILSLLGSLVLAMNYVSKRNRLKRFLVGTFVFFLVIGLGRNYFTSKDVPNSKIEVAVSEADDEDYLSGNADEDYDSESDEDNEKSRKGEKRVSFMGVGDNLIHESIYKDVKQKDGTYDFRPIYKDVEDMIKSKDLSYIDQESMIAGDEYGLSGYPNFNTPEDMAQQVKELGFDIVNISNNHILDRGASGVKSTLKIWEDLGLTVDGAFATEEDSEEIPVIEKNGIKIAFLCYTYGTNGIQPDTNWRVRYLDPDQIRKDMKKAKEISDFVLVSAHWGDENYIGITDYQETYATVFNELGADVVLGTHPHVIGPVEEKISSNGDKTLVIYSTGNYVSAMSNRDNMLGYTATFDFVKDGDEKSIENIKMLPTITYFDEASNDRWVNFKIYKLENYTEEMAKKHLVGKLKNVSMSPKYFKESFEKTVDEKYR